MIGRRGTNKTERMIDDREREKKHNEITRWVAFSITTKTDNQVLAAMQRQAGREREEWRTCDIELSDI